MAKFALLLVHGDVFACLVIWVLAGVGKSTDTRSNYRSFTGRVNKGSTEVGLYRGEVTGQQTVQGGTGN